jgi:hypothetical protein
VVVKQGDPGDDFFIIVEVILFFFEELLKTSLFLSRAMVSSIKKPLNLLKQLKSILSVREIISVKSLFFVTDHVLLLLLQKVH